MKEKLRKLVEEIDDIRNSAHEMHVSGFLNLNLFYMMCQNS